MVWLNRTYYSLLNFTSKIFQNWVFRAKFKQIKQNPLNYAKFTPIINLFILCFRGLPRQRTLTQIPRNSPTQSANSAKFAPFVNLSYIMFQAPAPAENPEEFQQITQIPPNSPTQSTNHGKFTPFAKIIYYV